MIHVRRDGRSRSSSCAGSRSSKNRHHARYCSAVLTRCAPRGSRHSRASGVPSRHFFGSKRCPPLRSGRPPSQGESRAKQEHEISGRRRRCAHMPTSSSSKMRSSARDERSSQ
eukprot:6050911-Prymnesium_polylepis.1